MPAASKGRKSPPPRPSPKGEGDLQTQIHNNGAASAQRQNALATGPVSESLTRMGAKAIAHPPASRQRKAARLMEARII